MKATLWLAACCVVASGATVRLERRTLVDLQGERIAGAAWRDGTLYSWGDRVLEWNLPSAQPAVLRGSGAPLGEGGAVTDFDGDGRLDVVVNERGSRPALVWLRAPGWERRVIDDGVETRDIEPATFHGRRGVLVIHKGMQVRFYQPGGEARDLYSFYSASLQSGLLLADIDGDGRTDIVCGNYWIQQPPEFDLSWRLFAIRAWSEEKLSAMSVFTWWGDRLVVAQSEMKEGRAAWFAQPADPRQLWEEHRIGAGLRLAEPHSLAAADFDGDGQPELLVAERGGEGRLVLFRKDEPEILGRTSGILWARVMDWDGDSWNDLLGIDRRGIAWWKNAR